MAGLPDDLPPDLVLPTPQGGVVPAVPVYPWAPAPEEGEPPVYPLGPQDPLEAPLPGPASPGWPGGAVAPVRAPAGPPAPPATPAPTARGAAPGGAVGDEPDLPHWLPPEIARQWRGEPPSDADPGLVPGEAPGFHVDLGRPPTTIPLTPGRPALALPALGGQAEPAGEESLFPWEAPGVLGEAQRGELTPEGERAAAERQSDELLRGGREAIAKDRVNREFDRAELERRLRAAALETDAEISARNLRTWQAAGERVRKESADLRMRAHELANTKVDRRRAFKDASIVGNIGRVINAVAQGFLAPYNGGRNSGLEMIKAEMDADVDAQVQDLQNARAGLQLEQGAVAEEYARSGDLFHAAETVRIANRARLEQQIGIEAARFDPKGTRAALLTQERMAVREETAKRIAAVEEALHKRAVEDAEVQIKQADFQLRRRTEARVASQAATARQQAAAEAREKEAQWAFEHNAVRDPKTGAWVVRPKAPGESEAPTDPRLARAYWSAKRGEQEAAQFERGREVYDDRGNLLGKAQYGPTGKYSAPALAEMTGEYVAFRKQSVRLKSLLESHTKLYGGIGSGRWPQEARTAVDAIKQDLAVRLAKIRDPESVAREGEVAAAAKVIPEIDTWTTSKNPRVAYRELMKTADQDYESRLGTGLGKQWDRSKSPTRHYQQIDALLESGSKEKPLAATVEDLRAPISRALPPELRDAALVGRASELAGLSRSAVKADDLVNVKKALDQEVASGDLSEAEHAQLLGALSSAVDRHYRRAMGVFGAGPAPGQIPWADREKLVELHEALPEPPESLTGDRARKLSGPSAPPAWAAPAIAAGSAPAAAPAAGAAGPVVDDGDEDVAEEAADQGEGEGE